MEKTEYIVQMQELLNLIYSTLDTLQAQAENLLDTVAIERAALDTLAAPAFSSSSHHQTVTIHIDPQNPQSIEALGVLAENPM